MLLLQKPSNTKIEMNEETATPNAINGNVILQVSIIRKDCNKNPIRVVDA